MNKVITLLKTELKINQKSTLILSVSGGVDSMVLLTMLTNSPYRIVVVHFNHLKRNESIIEKDLVEKYCKTHEIPFHYYTISIKAGNFHHQAHQMRNHYLNEVAHLYKTPYILTAHHADDLFENVLIKLTRGSNLLGYAGMQLMHSTDGLTYIKPLLYTSKEEIYTFAEKNNVQYLVDSSNEENFYLRNRYRHAVVPIMKQENANLLEQITQYNKQITHAFDYIRNTTKSLIKKDMIIPVDKYKLYDEAIQDDVIAYLIESEHLTLSYEIIQKIKKILLSNKPNQIYKLSKNHSFIKAYHEAYIKTLSLIKPVKIKIKEGENDLLNVAIFTFFQKTDVNTEDFIKLCYNKLAFPLWIRHREDGDLLAYEYGHKKLKKLLIDLKIPNEKRKNLWVLTDNDNRILWVENYYVNQTLGDSNTIYFKLKGVRKNA
ncbi:MAG: tRNA lysidine(34) synthetase TilS [Acholeplasmataceae bacterium]|nr:tRNA lysidine(34) synthetase TilS [Acholeplasmataceae bacterium]